MFGDIFEAAEDMEWTAQIGTVLTYEQRKPKNCAHFLELPNLQRDKNAFCGLKNQGATCYLNSLIQLCYMSPEFRNTILSLPLCNGTIDEPSEFVPAKSTKHKILFGLQKLFSEMQELDVRSVSTEKVTDSFGWNDNQALVQQDIQEANRVIFDVIDRALFGTAFSDGISKYYKGTMVNVLECLSCGLLKEREESFYDLILQVKDYSSIEESLINMLTLEKLEGSNQYFCDTCQKKVDAYKGVRVRKFPPILTLSLSRFEYDYMKGEMKKINDSFAFGLELDLSLFAEKPELLVNEDDKIYELAGVLIHRGNPYGGHYHAYIRDQLNEGEWAAKFAEATEKKDKRKKEKEAEQKLKEEAEKAEKAKAAENEQKDGQEGVKAEGETPEEKVEEIQDQKTDDKNQKKNKKNKDKGNKRKRNDEETANKDSNTNTKPQDDKDKKREIYDDTVMDDIDFPIPFTRKELAENWFDFNDSTVTAIPVNRIQTQFGGRSTENAYILLYRQRSLANDPEFKKKGLLPYLNLSVETQNVANENERIAYAEAENELEMIFLNQDLINFPERKFKEPTDPIKAGNKLRLKFESTLKNVFQELKLENPENYVLVEMQNLPNNMIQFKRTIDYSSADQKITELNIECWSIWLPFKKDDKIFVDQISSCVGTDAVPIKVNVRNPQSKDTLIITFLNRKLQDFKKQVEEISEIPAEQQLLLLMDGDLPKMLNANPEDEEKDLKALGIGDNADVMVNLMDPEELRKQRELQAKQKEDKENANKKDDENIAYGSENLVSVLVERDDEDGVIKYYVDLDWTLAELIENIKKKLSIPADSERRLKKLNDKNVFYEEDLPLLLRNLNFIEGGIRLRMERGKTPQLGNLSICVRYQPKDVEPVSLDMIALPGETLFEIKKRACETLGLDEKEHKLYETDWLEDAVQLYGKEDRLLREAGIKQGALIVLRHVSNPIPKEILKVNLFETKTGFPTDNEYIGLLQVKEEQTLLEMKRMILQMVNLEGQIDPERLRVREIRKDFSFGKIYKDNNKNLKKLGIETNSSLTFQIREREENLKESTLVLLLRKRIVESQSYTGYEEFIWEASKEPTIEELKKAVVEFKKLEGGLEGVELAKYVSHEFHWLHVSKEEIEKGRVSKKGNKGKQQQNNKGNNKKGKEGEEAKGNKQQQQQQAENLRKAPFLLTDGDVISYRIEAENVEKKDDFQTKEDEENFKKYMEAKKKAELEKTSSSNRNRNVGGFKIYTDF